MKLMRQDQLREVSEQRGMAVEVVSDSQRVVTIAAETVQLEFYSTGTLTTDAGEAAGTVVVFKLANAGVLNAVGDVLGHNNDTSFVFGTGTILTTRVAFKYNEAELHDTDTGTLKADAITAGFANGEYTIDHRTGTGYGVKTTTGTADTATYKISVQQASSGGGVSGDVNITEIGGTTVDATAGILHTGPSASTGTTGTTPLLDEDGDNTAQVIKAGAGNLYGLHVINLTGVDAYIQLFNTAAGSVTVGTTTPVQSYLVPANGAYESPWTVPQGFSTAITYACTTGVSDNVDPSTGLIVNAQFI